MATTDTSCLTHQVVLALVIWSSLDFPGAQASTKKGLCVGPSNFLCDDFKVWDHVNWWYDWTMNFWMLHHHSNCTEFSPGWAAMVWGWRLHADYPVVIPPNAEYVLGFNEPNMKIEGNLTARQAASHWRTIERHSRGLPLVSPAAAPCTNPSKCHADVIDWFDEFFKHCNGCRVDYLATHAYYCSADTTMNLLETLWKRYGKKIWLTEFACPHTHSAHVQLQYMKSILPRLEAADYVFRYSWFVNRITTSDFGFMMPSASLLMPNESKLTALGHYYNKFQHAPGQHIVG